MAISIVLLGIAVLAVLVGTVLLLVEAFRESVLWGMAYLFVPFANLVFVVCHWDRAKTGFFVSLGGTVMAVALVFSLQKEGVGMMLAKAASMKNFSQAASQPKPSQDLSGKIQAVRDRIAKIESDVNQARPEMIRQFNELAERRKNLAAADAGAISMFNEDAAKYQKLNGQRKAMLDEVQVANQELTGLMAEQIKEKAAKRVVMYTTSSCGACKVAKLYFAQKGVPFEEIDVQRSPAGAEEFKRLGGRGVPLIVVGDKRVEGFNAQAIDAML